MNDATPAAPKSAPPGSPTWYALLFTPEPHRDVVAALLELRADILEAARRPVEPAVARARLQWWRAELYRRHLAKLHAASFNPRANPGNLENLWTAWRAARRAGRTRG